MPEKLPSLEYPVRLEVRYVSANNGIHSNRACINVSITWIGEYVGFKKVDDRIWNAYSAALLLGCCSPRSHLITCGVIEPAYASP